MYIYIYIDIVRASGFNDRILSSQQMDNLKTLLCHVRPRNMNGLLLQSLAPA